MYVFIFWFTYSEFIDYIRWSYNRDGENLPQVNLLMVTSEETHLPIYYRILSGSIKDVSTIHESLANFKLLGSRSIHLIMDKGFYSEPNINGLYENHYRFSVGVPFTASIATDAVEENRMDMDSHEHFINIGEDDLYAVTKCTKWNGHRCYIHTYYDSLKAELENKNLPTDCSNAMMNWQAIMRKLKTRYFMTNISLSGTFRNESEKFSIMKRRSAGINKIILDSL